MYAITDITAPSYAPDGSRGYLIDVTRTFTVQTGPAHQVMTGWVDRASGGRVMATLDSYPWEFVTASPVSDADWSEQWIRDNAAAIVGIYGWKG